MSSKPTLEQEVALKALSDIEDQAALLKLDVCGHGSLHEMKSRLAAIEHFASIALSMMESRMHTRRAC